MAERILMNEFRALSKERWVNVELQDDDIFKWNVAVVVLNQDSLYYGGYFKATMKFPANYPYEPPGFQFTPALYHPNIYPDGKVCISILHPAGDDIISGELAHERWSPVQRVESVLISILSLLDDAETSSPANVDAAVMLRKNPDEYRAIVRSNVEVSQAGIPEGFEMPTHESTTMPKVEKEDPDFWADSDDENDTFTFGGSDSGEDLDMDDFSVTDDGSGGGDDTKDAEDEISSFRPLVA